MLPQPESLKLYPLLLDGGRHTGQGLQQATGVKKTTVYNALRRMSRDGWLTQIKVPGETTREYVATELGKRRMRFSLQVHDGSRDSSPTA